MMYAVSAVSRLFRRARRDTQSGTERAPARMGDCDDAIDVAFPREGGEEIHQLDLRNVG